MMEGLMSILVVILGLLARFGIPLAVTLLIVMWMRRLDEQWKEQAQREQTFSRPRAKNSGCWKVNNCSPERRASCPAYSNPEMPCWQVYRAMDGHLLDTCLGCKVFRGAPVPA
jgi:hypothetical protein